MISRANVADSPLCPAGPEQSQASLQLASFTWFLTWLALAGREGGQMVTSLRFPKGSHRRDEGSFFPSSCLLPSVPYRCVPRHVGQSPCRSMKLCTENWRQDMHTPPLLSALAPPPQGFYSQTNGWVWETGASFSSLVLSLSFPLCIVITITEDIRTVPGTS